MDEIDIANEEAARLLEMALAVRRPTLKPMGCCYNCDAPLEEGRLYCDADCRDTHDHRVNRLRQQGE